MSRIKHKLQIQGPLLSALAALVLSACAGPQRAQAVIITDGARFAPASLDVSAGEQVVWRNRSPDRHRIVVEPAADGATPPAADDGEGPRSGDLYHDEQWSLTFDRPGVYRFACAIHRDEDMVGVVTVRE